MLSPVADHQAQAHHGKREDEHEGGSAGIDIVVQHVKGNIVADLPECALGAVFELSFPEEVQWEFEPDEEHEATDVAQEVWDAVAVIVHCRAQVVSAVAFHVVVLDVMVVVRVPRVTVHRVEQVREQVVEQPELWGEDSIHVDVLVLHQGESAAVEQLHEPVQDTVKVRKAVI